MRRFLVGCAVAALVPIAASALPGQSVASFKAWAHGNAALGALKEETSEMSGQPFFKAPVRTGPKGATFLANVNDGKITSESIGVGLVTMSDMAGHREMAAKLVSAVYGGGVGADVSAATVVGRWKLYSDDQTTLLLRGKRYGYELAHAFVKVIPATAVDDEAKYLAQCAKTECGD